MKTLSFIILFLFLGTLTGNAQSRYAVEFIGGMKYNGLGSVSTDGSLNGITGGLGASVYLGKSAELVGTTLFTYYPPSNFRESGYRLMSNDAASMDHGQYSCEVSAGLRLHGQGSQLLHPYFVVQGGMLLLRSTIYQGAWVTSTPSATQFLNIHGTEDFQMLGAINVGVGLQACITESILLNFEAKYQMLVGSNSSVSTFVPVFVSVQLPV
jgi:hypothetical protein